MGLSQQIGHRGHPVGRDVLQDLQPVGPLLQVPDAELRVPRGLPHQLLARPDQLRQPLAIGPLAGRLVLQPPPRLRGI